MTSKKVAVFILFSIFYFLPPVHSVFASEVFFEQRGNVVDIFLDTRQESINAFEGKVVFSAEMLELKKISDGNGIVNFWIKKPEYHNGEIIFSGITPGGFSGNRGLLFSAVFEIKKSAAAAVIDLREGVFLKNDGSGTQDSLMVTPFSFLAARAQISSFEVKDTIMPENFVPQIAKDQNVFNNKWFLVFNTQDKNSGMDHYEVKESNLDFLYFLHPWIVSESPYLMQDQGLRGHVLVKAVDKQGNERIVSVNLPNHLLWYQNIVIWTIIIVALGIFVLVVKRSYKLWLKKGV